MQRLAPIREYSRPERGGICSLSLAPIREIYIWTPRLVFFKLKLHREIARSGIRNTSDLQISSLHGSCLGMVVALVNKLGMCI